MDGTSALDTLRSTSKTLGPELKAAILALGPDAVAPLVAIMQDDALGDPESAGEGWPPVHAVELLAELEAAAAVEPMLDLLEATHFDTYVHDRILLRMPRIGAPALDPILARLERAVDDDHFSELCSVLAKLGVRDQRIFDALATNFDEDVILGSIQLADYGDRRGLPLIAEAIHDFEIQWGGRAPIFGLEDLAESYEVLSGGPLPALLQARVDDIRARFEASRTPARSVKTGRNDPCPCGSGKKFKKCCVDRPSPQVVPNR